MQTKGAVGGRIEYFDVAKGIGILMVILGHFDCPDLLHRIIFSVHMPLFFLISGYFFKKKDTVALMSAKAKHLLLPYLLTGLAGLTISSGWFAITGQGDWKQNLLNWLWAIFYGVGNSMETPVPIIGIGAIWFLLATFFASIIFNICLKSKYKTVWMILIAWIGYLTMRIIRLPFSIQPGMFAVVYLYVGYLAREKKIFEQKDRRLEIITTILAALVWAVYLYGGGGKFYLVDLWFGKGIIDIPATICATYVVIQISRVITHYIKVIKRMLHFWGANSLKVMCLHLLELKIMPWETIVQAMGIEGHRWQLLTILILKLLWAGLGTVVLNALVKLYQKIRDGYKKEKVENEPVTIQGQGRNRVGWIDVAKGVSILLMIYTHLSVDGNIRHVVFSFHMPIFMILSGYLYRKESIKNALIKKSKGLLIPYLWVEAGFLIAAAWRAIAIYGVPLKDLGTVMAGYLKTSFWGISFTSTILTDVNSVGPVWFVICLFFAQILYTIISNIAGERERLRAVLVLIVTVLGWFVGRFVAYLPWSLDVSMVSVFFLYVGNMMKKHDVLQRIIEKKYVLGVAVIWIAGIVSGGIELASRSYPVFPLCLVGATAGSIVVMLICQKCAENEIVREILSFFGRNSMLVLGLHCLELIYCSWNKILPGVSNEMIFVLKIIFNISGICIILSVKYVYAEWKRKRGQRLNGSRRKQYA